MPHHWSYRAILGFVVMSLFGALLAPSQNHLPHPVITPAPQSAVKAPEGKAQERRVPPDLLAEVQRDQYQVVLQDNAAGNVSSRYMAANPAQAWQSFFSSDGLTVSSAAGNEAESFHFTLRAGSYGYGMLRQSLRQALPVAEDNWIEYRREDLTEKYVNDERGLEHILTLTTRPAFANEQNKLALDLAFGGNLLAQTDPRNSRIYFVNTRGTQRLIYREPSAYDAHGKPLTLHMRVRRNVISLMVDDAAAVYPITVNTAISGAILLPQLFGYSVAISNDTVVVGAKDAINNLHAPGAAYVFERAGSIWRLQTKLLPFDLQHNVAFGSSVAISNDTIIVGAPEESTFAGTNSGSAYVYKRGGPQWILDQQIVPPSASAFANFGISVAISSDTAIIGANFHDTAAGLNSGAAFVFTRNEVFWNLQQQLLAADAGPNDLFGSAVTIFDESVLIGAPFDDTQAGMNAGSAYMFVRNGAFWSLQQQLFGLPSAVNNEFGHAVALSRETALIGAPGENTGDGNGAGAVHVFQLSNGIWNQGQLLTANDGAPFDSFGYSVALNGLGTTAVVGAPGVSTTKSQNGAAYVFDLNGTSWNQHAKFASNHPAELFNFGYSVSIHRNTAVVGAPQEDAAYVFIRCEDSWALQERLTADLVVNEDPPAVVLNHAPLVFLYPNETYKPADPLNFIFNSSLEWHHESGCTTDSPVAAVHSVSPWELGSANHLLGRRFLRYSHSPTNPLPNSCEHLSKIRFRPSDHTRPYDSIDIDSGESFWDIWLRSIFKTEGFYLDLVDDPFIRFGIPSTSCDPDIYTGATVFYEYEPQHYITYWFFYAYDSFDVGTVPFQFHEGDWERISVLLNCDDVAQKVFFYAHTGGEEKTLNEISLYQGTHPVVFSAKGSHASYAIPFSDGFDQTGFGQRWFTWSSLANVKTQPWYGYGGAWGEFRSCEVDPRVCFSPSNFSGPLGPSRYKTSFSEWDDDEAGCQFRPK